MSSFLPAGGSGTGGGILYPDSASRPFNSNSARNTWANNNKQDLIKDTTVVNVGGNQWYLWTGESNPDTVNNNLWMDADQIVPGEKGDRGDAGVSVTGAQIDGSGDLIIEKSDGDSINAGRAKGDPGGKVPHVLLGIPDGQLNASTDGQTFDLANRGNFDGYWEAINPATQISGGPNPPDGNFDVIDFAIPVDFYQEVNTAVTPNRVKQELTTFQGERKTVYYREGVNQLGGAESLSNSDWTVKNMIPILANSVTGTSAIPTRLIQLGQGMQADFQQDTAVIKSLAPFSEIVDIFASTTISSPSDNRTYSYKADDLSQQDFIWLNLEDNDLPDEWSIVVEVQYDSYSSLEVFFGPTRTRLFALFPGDGVIFKKINGNVQSFKISGVESNTLPAEFLNGQNAEWPNVPNNNYTIDQGTFTNWHPTVNGKQGYIFAQTFNDNFVQPGELPKVIHRYTFFCTDDDSVTGTVLIKTTRDKSELPSIQGKLLGEGSGGESGLPDNGAIDNLTASFETLAVGKWYVDGWENSSGLPDWDNADRIASLTVFGGYDGAQNGAFWTLGSHRKGVYSAARSSGVTSDWLRLDNATQVITSSSPLEVRKTGGSDHDAIAVTDAGALVFGTQSSEIIETQFRSGQRRFSADVRNADGTAQTLEQLAYVSDITSLEGPAIQWQRIMDAEPIATGTYTLEAVDASTGNTVKSGPDDWITMSYRSSSSYPYSVQLGMVKERKIKRGEDYSFYEATLKYDEATDTFSIEVNESSNQKSFDFSINAANRIQLDQQIINHGAKEGYSPWTRGSELNIPASELPKTIEVMAQPFVPDADDVNTLQINLPNKGDFEQYYHVPGINDQQAADNDLPHIESFEFIVFLEYFETGSRSDKVILRSEGDWLPMYGNQSIHHYEGIYTTRAKDEKSTPIRSVFKFRKLIQGATTGPWDGYTLVSQDANLWSELGTVAPVAATVDNSQNTRVLTDDGGNHFTVIKRMQPVFATDDLVKYQLIKLSSDEDASAGEYPEVSAATVGQVASGFALAFDDANATLANTSIYQIASGEFEFPTGNAAIGDPIYVDEVTGAVTFDESPYQCGWVVNGGIVLDIDMYNASVLGGGGLTQQDLEEFGRGIAVPEAVEVSGGNIYQQTTAVAHFTTIGTDINDVIIEIDLDLLESETIITVPSDSAVTTKAFDVVQVAGQGTSRSIKAGETWRVRMKYEQNDTNVWFWEKVITGGGGIVYGLSGSNDIIEDASVKAFAYVEGMPYHLLFETPATADQSAKARLSDTFPASKTFRFTPLAERTFEGVVAATSNEAGSPTLGQYADIPLYCFEPNAVVSRDQVGFINWPSTVQIDVSEGFYVFGTVSGWAGGADRNGTTAVYVGRNADNPKGGGGKIGFALVADRLSILTGNGSEDADNATLSQFNKESGVAHFYRYAFYVDRAGNMIYFVQDLNDGVTHQGTTTANLASLNNDSRLYVAYDREGANTSTIAVGETTLVMNNEGLGEQRWNWRN